jgi:hypothetical protein
MPPDRYTSIRVRGEVPPETGRLARQLAAAADRDVTRSAALLAAIRYALQHVPEVVALLPDGEEEEGASDTCPPA